ncbi:MAG: GDP-mannose 4,6-dehydratase [Candidatus Doudnabacteria bacterium]|nr:GDP-mannose 4,6-dehydratase [Candidatus Doudnabacteria bacterium]
MSKILVTGGAGFIGAHVAKRLLDEGHKVVIIDNFNDYYSPVLKEARIENMLSGYSFELHRINLIDLPTLEKVFLKGKFDKICHLAAQAGVRYSLTRPEVYEESNVKGFLNILECVRRFQVKTLIYASSSSVYGGNTKLPFSESDPVERPLSLYGATKRANELMAYSYHHLFGISTTGLRFFTVYGPFGRPDMALFLFTKAITNDKPIQVFNGGKTKRDFTYIDDIVSGVIAALERSYSYEIINLGRGQSQHLENFITEIEKSLGKKAERELLPLQPGDVLETFADISKAKAMLNYDPKVSIDEGIKKFVDWYNEYAHRLGLDR